MQPNESSTFAQALSRLACVFTGDRSSDDMALAYWEALDDLPLERVVAAMRQLARDSEYMPRPVHIRALADPNASSATDAWYAVRNRLMMPESEARKLRDAGIRPPWVSDPRIAATLEAIGGYEHLAHAAKHDRLEYLRRDFERAYQRAGMDHQPERKALPTCAQGSVPATATRAMTRTTQE